MSKLSHAGRLFADLYQFSRRKKLYWLMPLILLLLLVSLALFAGTSLMPFVYTLF